MQLSELQSRVLATLAGIEPPWTLTGGAALAGFHLGHRTTRDLDLFWHRRDSIADVVREVVSRLRADGLEVTQIRTSEAYCVLQVTQAGESVVVDLVAEPVAWIEPPREIEHRGVTIQVDTAHEILVNKLCALLHRSELRDLIDIEALIVAGADLNRALAEAPLKDGGFSGLTLGWTLSSWKIADAARAAGLASHASELERFRDRLLEWATGDRP
jgi:hypothetical protein